MAVCDADGTTASFPDSMTDAEIEAVLQARFGGPPASPVRHEQAKPQRPRQRFGVSPEALTEVVPKDALPPDYSDSRQRVLRIVRRPPR